MMKTNLLKKVDIFIHWSYYLLFFLVPLFLTPYNYELFEYNKMMLTYLLTIIICCLWIIKIILKRKFEITRTPLHIPLLIFFASQVISTILSIDRQTSIWGYYSRFNGGLLSIISYLLLYWAFINNFSVKNIKKLFISILLSAVIVSLYGILEHFGVDKNIWVQDVQNRVFSTLGQPNWLAAYLDILIYVSFGLGITSILNKLSDHEVKTQNIFRFKFNTGLAGYWVIGTIFYITLLFTKSRSGFIGFWFSYFLFWLILFYKYKLRLLKQFLVLTSFIFTLSFFIGTPFGQINRFLYQQRFTANVPSQNENTSKPVGSSIIDIGITESGTIRRIVWKGALDILRHYPYFGSGVETFAYAYYKFRPVEHNMTSEWDFLYNKAHNEYLNYAANTGFVGLGSYLFIILVFIFWYLNHLSKPESNYLDLGLFIAWISILITNFFGFSVVVVQLFYYLIPAFLFVRLEKENIDRSTNVRDDKIKSDQTMFIIISLLITIILIYNLGKIWYADVLFAYGNTMSRNQEYTSAYQNLRQAILTNANVPLYYDEFSLPAAYLAVVTTDEYQSTISAKLIKEAILASNFATEYSPNNVNFWKTRTRVFYTLSQLDEKYLDDAQLSLEKARILSPTDPKVAYNLALIYDKKDKSEQAISLLEETIRLKTDYRDAYFALGLFYQRDKNFVKARQNYEFILQRLNPNDEDAKSKLGEIK